MPRACQFMSVQLDRPSAEREGPSLVVGSHSRVQHDGEVFPWGRVEPHSRSMCIQGLSVTKEGEGLRKIGGLSYTGLKGYMELLLNNISGYDPKALGMQACVLVVPQQLKIWRRS